MADLGVERRCDEACGCPHPCPGGAACRCPTGGVNTGGVEAVDHKRCSCGEHCSCNPCRCGTTPVHGVGKAFCKCPAGCACVACAS
ncbi:hypothetical protein GIB67_026809 [Kingdonia uniflora]|uniref:Metallothionein n=1 Tax=Kingdonia uniflora TaxID=39325 RepID=A0A7J7MHG9_9MAGN|nr:hypothetical protein GIB67_026809 [Kingdonia uniflora]